MAYIHVRSQASLSFPFLSLKVRRIIVPSTSVATAEDSADGHRRRHGCGEARASTLSAGPGVAVLAKVDAVGALIAGIPDVPARAVDNVAHGGVLEDDAGVLAPGPTQVVGTAGDGGSTGGGDVAVIEDVVGCAVRGGAAVGWKEGGENC